MWIHDDDDIDNANSTHVLPAVSSKYYEVKEFNDAKFKLSSNFGIFHVNSSSLNAHIDDLSLILSRLDFDFDIIGLSEHRILKGVSLTNNISLDGYSELIFKPMEIKYGGTGIFV